MRKDFDKLFTSNSFVTGKIYSKKLNGFTMFTILFSLFILILGVTAGFTYSGFQSTAESNGALTFAVNGHQGTINLTHTNITNYTSTDLLLTFTLASETNYTTPTISSITMNSVPLTKDGNNFKSSSIIVATYSAPTLTINRANVSGNLVITGNSTAQTYTITYNANGGTGSMANTVVNYGSNANLRVNSFSRSGYTFEGWSTTSGGSVELCDGSIIKDLGTTTLYAIWELDYITITVTDTTSYYNINGSLYSRGVANYKCAGCNGYSTSSSNTSGCTHNYSGIGYKCANCDYYGTSAGGNENNYCSRTWHDAYYDNCSTCGGSGHGTYHAAYYDNCGTCGGSGQVVTGYGPHVDEYPDDYDEVGWCALCGAYPPEVDDGHCNVWHDNCPANPIYGTCGTCGGSGHGTYHAAYYDNCGTCGGSGHGTYHAAHYTYTAHSLGSTYYYNCSYCSNKSSSSTNTTGCTGHNHNYNTDILYYDYTRVYGSGSSTVSKSSASYSTGYYWHATYGALTLNSTLSYTDGYTYRVIQVMNNTTLKIKRETS